MKQTLEADKKNSVKLLQNPGLLKRIIVIFLLTSIVLTLIGILLGSLLTAKFFPDAGI
jgi:ABC-type lipoprotein release transport system permease subunit